MKRPYTLIIVALLLISLNSCSVLRSSPTPDDVYYSPGAPANQTASTQGNNSDYYSTPNDNYVKMRVQDPDRWSYFDDYNYDYYGNNYYGSNYGYGSGSSIGLSIGFGSGFYSPFYGGFGYYSPLSYYNSYYAWNNFYNPYYGGVIIVSGKNTTTPSYTRMSNFNPSAYRSNYYNTRPSTPLNSTRNSQNYYNTNPNSNFNRSDNTRPNFSTPSQMRSSPSNFSSGGSGGGGSRGGGFSRPGR